MTCLASIKDLGLDLLEKGEAGAAEFLCADLCHEFLGEEAEISLELVLPNKGTVFPRN